MNTIPKATKSDKINSTFVSPIRTFSLAANIFVHTPNQGTNKGKFFNHIIYKGNTPNLTCNKHFSLQFLPLGPRIFHVSTGKKRVQSVRNGHQSGYSRNETTNNNINKRSNRLSIRGNY